MTRAFLKISGAGAYAKIVHSKLPFSSIENGAVILQSRLGDEAALNDHLVWLWGLVKHERRVLKSAVTSGATITCNCVVPKGPVHVLPNGAEMLHLLGAELVLVIK